MHVGDAIDGLMSSSIESIPIGGEKRDETETGQMQPRINALINSTNGAQHS